MTHDDPVNLRVESNATWPVAAVSNALIENEVKKQSEGVLTWLLSVRGMIGRSLTVKGEGCSSWFSRTMPRVVESWVIDRSSECQYSELSCGRGELVRLKKILVMIWLNFRSSWWYSVGMEAAACYCGAQRLPTVTPLLYVDIQ